MAAGAEALAAERQPVEVLYWQLLDFSRRLADRGLLGEGTIRRVERRFELVGICAPPRMRRPLERAVAAMRTVLAAGGDPTRHRGRVLVALTAAERAAGAFDQCHERWVQTVVLGQARSPLGRLRAIVVARPRERRPGRQRRAATSAGPDDPDLADPPGRRGAPA